MGVGLLYDGVVVAPRVMLMPTEVVVVVVVVVGECEGSCRRSKSVVNIRGDEFYIDSRLRFGDLLRIY